MILPFPIRLEVHFVFCDISLQLVYFDHVVIYVLHLLPVGAIIENKITLKLISRRKFQHTISSLLLRPLESVGAVRFLGLTRIGPY